MKKIISLLGLGFTLFINAQTLTDSENYVYSKTCLDETCTKKSESVQYVDGLGRTKQVVGIAASPSGKDVVQTIEYDAFGRQAKDYLPIPQTGSLGSFYPSPLANANTVYGNERIYSEKIFESDISGQIKQVNPVGNSWASHPVKSETSANSAGDHVKKITITTSWAYNATNYTLGYTTDYPANRLLKSIGTDADGNETIEFKNGVGKTILLRKNDGTPQPVDTYYVYDEFGNLAYVLPPLASFYNSWSQPLLDDLCYQYRYDPQGRQVEKKLPGKGWEYLVYDQQDRLVMSQDANLGVGKRWMFTKYDKFGRVTYTGIANSTKTYGSSGRDYEQNEVNGRSANNTSRTTTGFTQPGLLVYYDNDGVKNYPTDINKLLSVNYYDTYPEDKQDVTVLGFTQTLITDNVQTANAISTKTLAVASYLSNTKTSVWTKSYIWYDNRSRPVATYSKNHLGGYTKTETFMDFAGMVQKTELRHKRKNSSAEIYVKQEYEYINNRLVNHYHTVNTQPRELLVHNEYKETGQLKTKKVGGSLAAPLQTVDYAYDIRGAMTGININNDGTFQTGKLFNYKINYNNDLEGLALPNADFSKPVVKRYNGSITEVSWRNDQTGIKKYGYVYDPLGRLLAGLYQNPGNPSSKEYSEIVTYDTNGNIKTLKRSAYYKVTAALQVDNLQYNYTGNRLNSVQDNPYGVANPSGYEGGGAVMSYDANGSITAMPDKGITNISYNYLDLPDDIVKGDDSSTAYIYLANGAKVKKTFTLNNDEGTTIIETDYLDGFQYSTPNTEPIRRAVELQDDATVKAATAGQEETFEPLPDRLVAAEPGGPVADDMILSFFPTAEGYYDYENMRYIYQYKDHLGNVRVSYVRNGAGALEVMDTNDYYPFGMSFLKPPTRTVYDPMAIPYNYKFGGKELQETGMYDFGARMYMPDLGRWGVVDPLAETSRRWSPYNYALDNPVMFIDPDGRRAQPTPYEKVWDIMDEWNGMTARMAGARDPIARGGGGGMETGGFGSGITFGQTQAYRDLMSSLNGTGPGPSVWSRIGNFFSNLFGGSKSNNGAIKQTRSGVAILMPGAVTFDGYAAGTAATETAVTGTGLIGGFTLGALLMPTMIAEPEFDWTRQFDIPADIPITTTDSPEGALYLYRNMRSVNGKPMVGEGLDKLGLRNGDVNFLSNSTMITPLFENGLSVTIGYGNDIPNVRDFSRGKGTLFRIPASSLVSHGLIGMPVPNPRIPNYGQIRPAIPMNIGTFRTLIQSTAPAWQPIK